MTNTKKFYSASLMLEIVSRIGHNSLIGAIVIVIWRVELLATTVVLERPRASPLLGYFKVKRPIQRGEN